ncbi:hypothetical protein [Paraburkholderia sacchari]|nr:hypothetical protein [Paraburkholderia sacchari]
MKTGGYASNGAGFIMPPRAGSQRWYLREFAAAQRRADEAARPLKAT